VKIKFLSNTYYPTPVYACVINMSYFMLKHWYSLYGKNPSVEWLPGELVLFDDPEIQIEKIVKEHPDVLGLAVFVWNETVQYRIAKEIKNRLPNTTIVLGGPQLIAHKDPTFFTKHPYVDYVVYGDGEKSFQQIIDYKGGFLNNTNDFVNIVMNTPTQENSYQLFPFEQLVDTEYFSTSPYLGQKEFIKQHVDYLKSRGVPQSDISIVIEFARGCMYNCTFCDWSQNLTKKVKRRKADWREELHFFKELDVVLRESDANFGQWKEDIEIYDYAVSLYDPSKNFRFISWNVPKLKKDAAYYLLKRNAELYNERITIHFQDINEDVLTKIERPSISWEAHKELILKLKKELNPEQAKNIDAQFIIGLPGQSFKSIKESMYRVWKESGVHHFILANWVLLPNSPGADIFYQRLHKIKWVKTYFIGSHEHNIANVENLEDLYLRIKNQNNVQDFFESTISFATAEMNYKDIMAISILGHSIKDLYRKFPNFDHNKIDSGFEPLVKRAMASAERQWNEIEKMIEKYGFLIFGSYDLDNKEFLFYYKNI
jgi:radical SAM superfamily enzyme YgiQ (UPF0313 family)